MVGPGPIPWRAVWGLGQVLRFGLTLAVAGIMLAMGVIGITITGRPLGHAFSVDGTVAPLQLRPLAIPSTVYDSKGNVIGVLSNGDNRAPVPLSAVSKNLINAVVDVEDNTFFQAGPIDIRGILRALRTDLLAGQVLQGGSTITQQLVKNAVLSPKRTISRKIAEAIDAIRLSQQMTKDQILARYLNTIYLGHGVYGVQAAAETYFGLPASRLDAAQSALLAAMIENPYAYDPIAHPAASRFRRNLALDQMVQNHSISAAQAAAAKREPLPKKVNIQAIPQMSAFLAQVIVNLANDHKLGPTRADRVTALYQGGLRIYTTLDPTLEAYANQAVANQMPYTANRFTAALIAMDPQNGDVRALISGNPTTPLGYDVATGMGGTGRQAGSSFKVFTLLAALESGINPNSLVDGNGPCAVDYPGAQPATIANAEPGYGIMTMVKATADSVNCAYVRIGIEVGLAKVRATAHLLGITSHIPRASPAIVIGSSSVTPLQMATAYSVLANGGTVHPPRFVTQVLTHSGRVLISPKVTGRRVAPANDVALADSVLQQVVRYGTGTAAALPGRPVAGKTGTTDNFADAWFDGFTPQLVTTVWMGAPSGEVPMTNVGGITVYGGTYPARIWRDFMSAALANSPVEGFPAPSLSGLAKPIYIYPNFMPGTILPQAVEPILNPPPPTTTTTAPVLPTSTTSTTASTTTTTSSTTTTTLKAGHGKIG